MDRFFQSRNDGKSLYRFLCPNTGADLNAGAFPMSHLKSVLKIRSKKFITLQNFQKPTCECSDDCQHTIPICTDFINSGHFAHWSQGCILSLLTSDEGVDAQRISEHARNAFDRVIASYASKYLNVEDEYITRIGFEGFHSVIHSLIHLPAWDELMDELLGRNAKLLCPRKCKMHSTSKTVKQRSDQNKVKQARFRHTVEWNKPGNLLIWNMLNRARVVLTNGTWNKYLCPTCFAIMSI